MRESTDADGQVCSLGEGDGVGESLGANGSLVDLNVNATVDWVDIHHHHLRLTRHHSLAGAVRTSRTKAQHRP